MTSTEYSPQDTITDPCCTPLDQMVCTGLLNLPEEILIFLSSFLIEEEVLALSDTCVYLKNILNCNKVWERFITEDLKQVSKILETQEQQVSPAFTPESGLCEAKLKVLRKNHLLDNWRNGRCAVQESSECNITKEENIEVKFYKEQFLFIQPRENEVEMWDIQMKPILLDTKPIPPYSSLLVIRGYLVVLYRCIVDVYQINVEAKRLTFIYSFSVPEVEVMHGSKPWNDCMKPDACEHGVYCDFEIIKVKDILVFSPREPDSYRVYLWDIASAKQVGKFRFQSQLAFEPISFILYSKDNQVFIENKQMDQDTFHYFKFDTVTQRFSETLFTDNRCYSSVLIYNKHCLKFIPNIDLDTLTCEFIELPSSVKVKEIHIVEVCPWFLEAPIVVTSGKIVIPCSDVYHVISTLSLETEVIIPHNASSIEHVCPVNVCGSLFLLTVENKNEVKVWDIEKKRPVFSAQPKKPHLNSQIEIEEGSRICGREYYQLYPFYSYISVEEENISYLHTKMVVFGEKRMTVLHFW